MAKQLESLENQEPIQQKRATVFDGVAHEFDTQREAEEFIATKAQNPSNIAEYGKIVEHMAIGRQVVVDLYVALRAQNLSQAQEADLIGRITATLITLSMGFVRGARGITNSLVVAGELTNARKNFILTKIDEAITQL